MLFHYNFSDNFIPFSCTNMVVKFGVPFGILRRLLFLVKWEGILLFLIYRLLITLGSILLEHLNITKPTLLKNIFSSGSN